LTDHAVAHALPKRERNTEHDNAQHEYQRDETLRRIEHGSVLRQCASRRFLSPIALGAGPRRNVARGRARSAICRLADEVELAHVACAELLPFRHSAALDRAVARAYVRVSWEQA